MATVFKNVVNDFIWPFQVNIHQFSPCIMESLYEFYEKKIPNIFRSINIQINLITYVWKKHISFVISTFHCFESEKFTLKITIIN